MNSSVLYNKKLTKVFIIISAVITLILAICIGINVWLFNNSKIFANVFIEDINIGNFTPDEAKLKLNKQLQKRLDEFVIQLNYNDNIWNLKYRDIDLNYPLDNVMQKAYKVGRDGNYFNKIKTIYNLRKKPKIIKLEPNYNLNKIENKIEEVSEAINNVPINAKIQRESGNFIITKEVLGVEVNKYILKQNIIDIINNFSNATIKIEVKNIEPEITEEHLSTITDVIGESVTRFNSKDKGRTENIKIAANAINNTILMPGGEFSFNNSTGPRSVDVGYKDAPVIVNGEFVTGIGGGICQLSTMLYQVALKSDIEIISRRNHGLPVGYVPIGQDATVAYDYIDLKFKNNKKYPIYIESFIKGEELYVKLYSKKDNNIYINLKSEILEVIKPGMQIKEDSNMYLSEKRISKDGKMGYRVATYKIYFKDGIEIKKELVSKDYYPPKDGIILVGTKEHSSDKNN